MPTVFTDAFNDSVQAPSLLTVPREIRDEIYDAVFEGATLSLTFIGPPLNGSKIGCTQKPPTELLLVSNQVREEALSRFHVHLNFEDGSLPAAELCPEDLPFSSLMRSAISSLQVHARFFKPLFPIAMAFPNLITITIDWQSLYTSQYLNVTSTSGNASLSTKFEPKDNGKALLTKNINKGFYDEHLRSLVKAHPYYEILQGCTRPDGYGFQRSSFCTRLSQSLIDSEKVMGGVQWRT